MRWRTTASSSADTWSPIPSCERCFQAERLAQEIAGCKKRIQEELQAPLRHFPYPSGKAEVIPAAAKEAIAQAGFETADTTLPGQVQPGDDPLWLRRIGVDPGVDSLWHRRSAAAVVWDRRKMALYSTEERILSTDLMRMQRVFREVLEDDSLQLSPNDPEATLPAWGSFAQVNLLIGLEEEFGVTFSIDEVAETKTVEGLRELIAHKTAGSGASGP